VRVESVWLRYDAHTVAARSRLNRDETALYDAAAGPRRWVAFKALTSTARLHRLQEQQIHLLYRQSGSELYCSCGLSVPAHTRDLAAAPGHLDPVSWHPTDRLVFERPEVVSGGWRLEALCQVCRWRSSPADDPAFLRGLLLGHQHLARDRPRPEGRDR
jgi:hypothetical protein